MIKDGANTKDIVEENPEAFIKFHKGIEKVQTIYAPTRSNNDTPKIEIYWGDSGTGKTRKAVEENPDAYILTKPNGNGILWWDGYTGQKTVIIDEFYGWVPYDTMLRILDRYDYQVQIKGGSIKLAANHFIITSNKAWEEWYTKIDNVAALARRIDEWGTITKFNKVNNNLGFA